MIPFPLFVDEIIGSAVFFGVSPGQTYCPKLGSKVQIGKEVTFDVVMTFVKLLDRALGVGVAPIIEMHTYVSGRRVAQVFPTAGFQA